jgi:hypothetical protein
MQHAGQDEIGDVLALATQQAGILASQQRASDLRTAVCVGRACGG